MAFQVKTAIAQGAATALLCTLAAPVAHAQVGAFSDYMPSGVDQFNYVLNRIQMQGILRNAERESSEKPQTRNTVIARTRGFLAPRKLARAYPLEQQAKAEQTFNQVLTGYGQIEGRFGIPRGDMAGAMAAFIAGSLSACRNEDIPDAGFSKAVGQLRNAIGTDPAFAQIRGQEKQEAYEQFAILGTMLALTRAGLKEKPNASTEQRMRAAGCSYLRQLDINPDEVGLTEDGLVLR